MSSKKAAIVTFDEALGLRGRLAANGCLDKDGRTITPKGLEVLARHGLLSPRATQEDRELEAAILARLSREPALLHELPGGYDARRRKLGELKAAGLVTRLPDGRIALTQTQAGLAMTEASADDPELKTHQGRVSVEGRVTLDFKSIVRDGDKTNGDRWAVLRGDALERLRGLPSGCADMTLSSGPYYQYRNYCPGQYGNEKDPEQFVRKHVDTIEQLVDKTSPRGTSWYVIQEKRDQGSLLATVHRIIADAVRRGILLVDEFIWAKDSCLVANSCWRSSTLGHEYVLVFASSTDYYWNPVDAREFNGNRMRNVHSVQRFPHRKEPWQKSHDATFPIELVQFALACAAPIYGRCQCGEPWEYEIKTSRRTDDQRKGHKPATRRVVGVRPRCGHVSDPEPILVLDAFAGVGTTGMGTLEHGNARFLGIELNAAHVDTAARNLSTIRK